MNHDGNVAIVCRIKFAIIQPLHCGEGGNKRSRCGVIPQRMICQLKLSRIEPLMQKQARCANKEIGRTATLHVNGTVHRSCLSHPVIQFEGAKDIMVILGASLSS